MRRDDTDRNEVMEVKFESLLRQTAKAFLVSVEGEESWVAKSQVDNVSELEAALKDPAHKQGADTIQVPRWLAEQNGWVDE